MTEPAPPELSDRPVARWWAGLWQPAPNGHWLTRFLVLRLLGLIYLMAFLTWVNQGPALVGRDGLAPAAADSPELRAYLRRAGMLR